MKKNDKKPLVITRAKLESMKREVGRKAVDTAIRCFALAMLDEGITDDTVVAVYNRAQRYSYWTEENVVRLKEVDELLARYGVEV